MPVDAGALASGAVTTLSAFSQQLAGLTSNSGYIIEGGKVTFNAVADDSGLAIFNITNAQSFFNAATAFDFKLDGAKSVLFNVFGEASDILNIGATFWGGMPANRGSEFLWNFIGSEILNFNSQFGGTVLAMSADVTSNRGFEGSIASNSLSQYSYVTSQSLSNVFAPPAAVPIPAAMPLFLSGLLGFAAVRRYSRKSQQVKA